MDASGLGARLARAVAAEDREALAALLHPAIDFRAMTPRMIWEADGPEQVLDHVLGDWYGEGYDVEALEHLETDAFADVERVGYRVRVRSPDGPVLVEQQAYLTERDGRIGWLRILCSGRRPAGG